jgi:hypothetical protein
MASNSLARFAGIIILVLLFFLFINKTIFVSTTKEYFVAPCPKDTYSDATEKEICTPCPSNTFTKSTGSTSIEDCTKTINTSDCLLSYTNTGLNFNETTKSQGNSLYYDLNTSDFNIAKDNSSISSVDSNDVILTKCILNKRLSERSELCQSNSPITTNSDGKVEQTNSHSLLQSFEYVNSKGICVDKTGTYIPYPELNPLGAIGSKEGVLSHIVKCSNPNDAKTCSYEYPLNGIKYTYNPCTSIGMVYDFDNEICVDPQTTAKSSLDNVCQTYQVYDPVTGKCLNVIKPVQTMPPNTKGFITKGDYKNCRTIDKGDCTLVYRLSSIDDTKTASTTNPCTSNNVFNFNTYTCDVPDRSS